MDTTQDAKSHIVVNNKTLVQFNNDLQDLIDCLPERGELLLAISDIAPQKTLVLHKPITIRSAVDGDNGRNGSQMVSMTCPQNGLFDIR